MKHATDEQLIALIQSTGDERAFYELFSRYDKNLRAFLRSKSSHDYIDDVLQETYVKAFINMDKFEKKSSYTTWLFKIAFNELLQYQRKTSVFDRLKQQISKLLNNTGSTAHNTNLLIDAERAISELSSIQQRVFIYSEIYGYSHAELSAKLNIPLGSIKTYIRQSKQQLEMSDK